MRVRTGARGAQLAARVAAASVVFGTLGVIGFSALSGPAQAGEREPAVTVGSTFPGPGITIGTLPPFTIVTVAPTFTIPPLTFVTVPTTLETTTTDSTTTAPTETTEPTDTTEATEGTEGADNGPGSPGTLEEQYTVEVTSAQVDCDGTIHVEYDTVADPQPATASNHLVVFNPSSNRVDFHVVETVGNPANGSFAFDEAGSIEDSYRVFVIVQFDAVNPGGPVAVDQVDVLPAAGC
jgi:hypothetical protein